MSNMASSPHPSQMPDFEPGFRSWFTPGNDWRKAIAQSKLPDDIQDIIKVVVRQSRLWRHEKYDVANDLISHFQDGAMKGQSFIQIAEEFGDPAVTAQLIRRSKLRSRPMFMKIFRASIIGLSLMMLAYLGMMAFFHMGTPTPSFDYMSELNTELVEIAPEEKAWNLYRPVWTKFGFSEGGGCTLYSDIFTEDEKGQKTIMLNPSYEDWPVAVASLEKHAELLDTLRMGAMLPSLGLELKTDPKDYSPEDFAALFPNRDQATYTSSWNYEGITPEAGELMDDALVSVLLPHIQAFRGAARAFHVDTRLAVVEGDSDRVVKNVKTVIGLGRQASEHKFLVCSLVGYAAARIGFEQLEEVLVADPEFFSDEQLQELQVAIEGANFKDWLCYNGERAFMKDIVQRIYTDDGNGDGRMTPVGIDVLQACQYLGSQQYDLDDYQFVKTIVGPASLVMCAPRKEITEKIDELIDQVEIDVALPRWLSEGTNADTEIEENRMRYLVLNYLFPATQQVRNAMDELIGRQEGVIAALAFHRYFKKYGEWPTELDQVSPEFIIEWPVDVVDGSPLKFNYENDELTIYSVGNDLDDDGAATGKGSEFHFSINEAGQDGDWILWPQGTSD